MAADNHDSDYQRGTMEISEQTSTYNLFMGLTKWGSLATAAILLFLTLWFAVGAGFLAAFIGAAVLMVAGIFFLRNSPSHPSH